MAAPPLSDELAWEAAEAFRQAGNVATVAADAIGISRGAFQNRLAVAARRGMLGTDPVMPGFVITSVSTTHDDAGDIIRKHVRQTPEIEHGPFNLPEGHLIKGVSALLDASGNVQQQWVKTREGELDPLWIAEKIKEAFADWTPAALPTLEPATNDDILTLIPLADMHLGLYAWGPESGKNWDLKTACRKYRETIKQVVECSPPSATAIVLGGGDYLHANTNDLRTRTGNVLDGDGRTDKVIDEAVKLAVFTVDLALQKHGEVRVRFLKGNHDEYASIAIVFALAAWYRNEPRVIVDKDPSLYWWFRFKNTLLGATHGHNTKITEMPLIMANRTPKDWGETKHRYIHTFHVHHKTQHIFESGGVIAESHQSPVPQDAYHSGRGYISGRSMQSITYHADRGEIVRNKVALD